MATSITKSEPQRLRLEPGRSYRAHVTVACAQATALARMLGPLLMARYSLQTVIQPDATGLEILAIYKGKGVQVVSLPPQVDTFAPA